MNILLDEVKTDYVMHFEDDWRCEEYFTIKNLLHLLKLGVYDQVVLELFYGNHKKLEDITMVELYEYIYDPDDIDKPDHYIKYEEELGMVIGKKTNETNWWWPGFTLNPSLFNIKKFKEEVGRFNEEIDPGYFEYDFSLRANNKKMKICFIDNIITHIGEISSYELNRTDRFINR
jgi:hypothetical protein